MESVWGNGHKNVKPTPVPVGSYVHETPRKDLVREIPKILKGGGV
jgi:hypothetical protein